MNAQERDLGLLAAERLRGALRGAGPLSSRGVVATVTDLAIRIEDRLSVLNIGSRVEIETVSGPIQAEIVGLEEGAAVAMPFGGVGGVRRGASVDFDRGIAAVAPSHQWLGRIIDGLGRPVDGKGPIPAGKTLRNLHASPPLAALRARLGAKVDFGVKALDVFCPARAGQRLGLFSGSGIGKSTLLAMIARNTACDVAVIALVGERGREVREFVEESLGEEGLARAVVVVATSDEPAMMRREAAFLAVTIAEHFRATGAHVLCLMDSLTRVAAAQREIGLAAGEPPTTKGYPPSVFALLPKLVERVGTGRVSAGAVTGVFTVLVEGDDHDEPVADAARALLDGHVVLDRKIAERGRFPAVDILRTLSRDVHAIDAGGASLVAKAARALAADYEDVREMLRIGAYRAGAHGETDRAIAFQPRLEKFLAQAKSERVPAADAIAELAAMLGAPDIVRAA